jgi:uncharacterized iron-regulated membrane protein
MRRLHRWISIVAAAFVLYVAVTGFVMAFDNVWGAVSMAAHGLTLPSANGGPPPALLKMFADDGTVSEDNILAMSRTTLAAASKASDAPSPRVVRLRTYGGMPQGVVITGDEVARQLVFDARTGQPAGLYEAGYPKTPMPFEWGAHETWKRLHRGDYFGLTGRWMDLLSGLAILFLTISGIVMYLQVRRARVRTGRRGVFWK